MNMGTNTRAIVAEDGFAKIKRLQFMTQDEIERHADNLQAELRAWCFKTKPPEVGGVGHVRIFEFPKLEGQGIVQNSAKKQIFVNYYNRINPATKEEVCFANTAGQNFVITPTHRLDGEEIFILTITPRGNGVRACMSGGIFPTKQLAMQGIIDAARIELESDDDN